jgi:hypothetical protein
LVRGGSWVRVTFCGFLSGLILVSEPYFNEAGYERQKGSQQGAENSRMYNEMAILKLVQVRVWELTLFWLHQVQKNKNVSAPFVH